MRNSPAANVPGACARNYQYSRNSHSSRKRCPKAYRFLEQKPGQENNEDRFTARYDRSIASGGKVQAYHSQHVCHAWLQQASRSSKNSAERPSKSLLLENDGDGEENNAGAQLHRKERQGGAKPQCFFADNRAQSPAS